jgi:hypothetical protein
MPSQGGSVHPCAAGECFCQCKQVVIAMIERKTSSDPAQMPTSAVYAWAEAQGLEHTASPTMLTGQAWAAGALITPGLSVAHLGASGLLMEGEA